MLVFITLSEAPMSNTLPKLAVEKMVATLAGELNANARQVIAAIQLFDEGATVPFVARYRKEITGNLDDTQLRLLDTRLAYLRDLELRRLAILESVEQQGKLSEALRVAVENASTKQELEDLYLPYRPKRRSRAQIAREAGLEPLAHLLLNGQKADPPVDPQAAALAFVNAGNDASDVVRVPTVKAALDGARDILAERFAETAELLANLRNHLWKHGLVASAVVPGKESDEAEKFRDYYAYREPISRIPSHRALALLRGRSQGVLQVHLGVQDANGENYTADLPHPCEQMIAAHFGLQAGKAALDVWLSEVCRWTWRVKVQPQLEGDLLGKLREEAEAEATRIFARNLRELLLAAPAGPRVMLGIDPGIRTGCKVAVVDSTGKLLETATIYPHEPRKDRVGSLAKLADLVRRHAVRYIAIGNGTASRETDRLVAELLEQLNEPGLIKAVVSEAGASVYSASEFAAREFPDLDVSLRGAVSIARRLQDPLAELVKIDPKAIGVGQYQHDVNQRELARTLDGVVEDCVNAVGVDVNTASLPLLSRVAGLNAGLARQIVAHRETHGAFLQRAEFLQVPGLGPKTYEQAAGFMRIHGGANPLDASAVHPEAYPLVERMLMSRGQKITDVLGRPEGLRDIDLSEFADERFGVPTLQDIMQELQKPGRDPRPEFRTATFHEGIEKLEDLQPGMELEGVVTNVAAFGAFVNIGVHQDGLVHVSMLADRFVSNPHDVVKPGQVVRVRVLEIDVKRQRVSLSMRRQSEPVTPPDSKQPTRGHGRQQQGKTPRDTLPSGSMAQAFARLKSKAGTESSGNGR